MVSYKMIKLFEMRNIALAILLSSFSAVHCQSQRIDSKDFNSFDFYTVNKEELKDLGFKSIKLIPEAGDPESWFKKIIADTILQFHFDENVLSRKEVIFDLKKIDTSWLFNHLHEMGFQKGQGSDSLSKFVMAQPDNKNAYDVYINRKEISFVRWVNRPREPTPSPARTTDN